MFLRKKHTYFRVIAVPLPEAYPFLPHGWYLNNLSLGASFCGAEDIQRDPHVNPREKSTVRRIGHPRNPLDTAESCLSWQLCIMDADHDGGFQLSTGACRHRHHIIDGDGPVLCGIGIVSQNRGQRKRECGIRD